MFRVVLLKPGAYEELQRQQTLINGTEASLKNVSDEAHSDSGNESVENRSNRGGNTSDCHSD